MAQAKLKTQIPVKVVYPHKCPMPVGTICEGELSKGWMCYIGKDHILLWRVCRKHKESYKKGEYFYIEPGYFK